MTRPFAAILPVGLTRRVSNHLRSGICAARYQWRRLGGDTGVLPDFLIVGAMKSGTTSLFNYVCQHPGIVPPTTKELHFFNTPSRFRLGERWYSAQFPTATLMQRTSERLGYRALTGEATPQMHMPLFASRAKDLLPEASVIMILRDPVSRAFSHYQHWHRRSLHWPKESFWDALQLEHERVRPNLAQIIENPDADPNPSLRFSYQTRGHYAEQIEQWCRHFPRHRVLILNFDDFRHDAQAVCDRLFRFLGLPECDVDTRVVRNASPARAQMDERSRAYLVDYFRPHNRKLFALLGEDWGWPS